MEISEARDNIVSAKTDLFKLEALLHCPPELINY